MVWVVQYRFGLVWYVDVVCRGMLSLACLQNVDLVIEGTGVFVNSEGAGKHLTAGAKKVSPASVPRCHSLVALHADSCCHSVLHALPLSCGTLPHGACICCVLHVLPLLPCCQCYHTHAPGWGVSSCVIQRVT